MIKIFDLKKINALHSEDIAEAMDRLKKAVDEL